MLAILIWFGNVANLICRVEMISCPCCGYTFFFFFTCDNLREANNDPGLSSFGNVVRYLALKVKRGSWMRVAADNLYGSAPLAALLRRENILFISTARTNSAQWPAAATQKKLSGKAHERAKGTLIQMRPTPPDPASAQPTATLPGGAEHVLVWCIPRVCRYPPVFCTANTEHSNRLTHATHRRYLSWTTEWST